MTETAEQKLARYESVLDAYMVELDKLRDENERLRAGADARTTLQSIYRNPEAPEGNRIKAAAASLPFETPKLMPERAPLELAAAEIIPLRKLVEERRRRQDQLCPESVDHNALDLVPVVSLTGNGNGGDEPSGAGEE